MLTKNEIKDNAYAFIKDHENDTDEKQQAGAWIKDFLGGVFGLHNRKVNAGFEWRVKTKSTQQYIDHLLNGELLIEMKSRGQSLEKAKSQAYNYVMKLKKDDIPKYVMLCDFERIQLYDLDNGKEFGFPVVDLVDHIEVFNFLINKDIKVTTPQSPVNKKAAIRLEQLHIKLRELNYPPNATALLMTRIVFCLFAENTQIFEANQFHNYLINHTQEDGSDLVNKLNDLFIVLNTPKEERFQTEPLTDFEYVNGGLFKMQIPTGVVLNSEVRKMLIELTRLDWSEISPIVFGSMFEGAMDPESRHDLGAHFTSETNIIKVVDSLFLDDLTNEFEHIKGLKIGRLAKYRQFHEKLAELKFLDPACGSGNFLIVAYREIRRLEHEVIQRILYEEYLAENNNITAKDAEVIQYNNPLLSVDEYIKVEVSQFYGIEIQPYAASIARLGLWLMEHLMNLEASSKFGENIVRLPLHEGARITVGDALKLKWEDIVPASQLDYILGNPPFLGSAIMSKEQKDLLVSIANGNSKIKKLDFVAGWHIKSAFIMKKNPYIRTALVSTNSITQGEQAIILWHFLFEHGITINFAHRTFSWDNKGANVYVVIVGFGILESDKKYLFEYEHVRGDYHKRKVSSINEYLLGTNPVFIQQERKPISNNRPIERGSQPTDGGNLILSIEERNELLKEYGSMIEEYIRPFIGARELLYNIPRWILYLKDITPNELRKMPKIMDRIEKVRDMRLNSKSEATRKWAERPTDLQQDKAPSSDVLGIPKVSSENREYVPMSLLKHPAIPSDLLFQMREANLFVFGILQTKMHTAWLKTVGGRLKSDVRYSNTLVYNTFVFPEVTDSERVKIEGLAQSILNIREKYFEKDNTLADLYDPLVMPYDLRKAHNELDKAVEIAYNGKPFDSDEQRAEFLIKLYQKHKKTK
ncbi:N-6 DNA methylase [Alkalibacterium iburiense]|uniref:site-specific DNA-methyltransferase (adenine-specific) n=1 Tax=Alkalibacterium iburiense TaxID=290589 RepID=A0ABP3GVH8_9LACT